MKFNYTNLIYQDNLKEGITTATIKNSEKICQKAHQEILKDRKNNILGFYDLPEKNVSKILTYVKEQEGKFDDIIVLGIGGSALGNSALYSALKVEKSLKKNLYVCDNVDPYLIKEILSKINLKRSLFNVITKSGTTAETMSTFLIFLEILKKELPETYKNHLVITTDKEKGFLREVINKEDIANFEVPDNVGGRFSILTDVGLLSSALVGIDIEKLLAGAASMKKKCENSNISENPAYINALLHYFYMKNGKNISVMMPYSNPLYLMADWYRQLWAESLGKKNDVYGNKVFVGQTPVKALGTTDQHSQVQLYVEGPNDKVVTFISVKNFTYDYEIPFLFQERDEINYLGGKKISELLNAEQKATEIALTNANRPNCHLILPQIDEFSLGEFIFMYEVQTVFAGKLLDIDPLNQPGVEAGKIATYALMGKKGFEKELEEIQKSMSENQTYEI